MTIGSTYGSSLYSGGLYSWLTVWFQIACDPVIYRDRPLPPIVPPYWSPVPCQPVMERNRPLPPLPPANWQPIVCTPVDQRRETSIHGH